MKIKGLGVGTRLGGGFLLVVLLIITMVVTGAVYLRGMMGDTHTMAGNYLVRERLSTEWLSIQVGCNARCKSIGHYATPCSTADIKLSGIKGAKRPLYSVILKVMLLCLRRHTFNFKYVTRFRLEKDRVASTR